jgi:hypothetical protein
LPFISLVPVFSDYDFWHYENKCDESELSCLAPDLKEKLSALPYSASGELLFSIYGIYYAEVLSSMPNLFDIFCHEEILNFINMSFLHLLRCHIFCFSSC